MTASALLIDRFKQTFRSLHASDLSRLRSIYSDRIVYRDPVQEIRGLVGLEDYYTAMCADLDQCRYEFLDQLVGDSSAYLKWILHFRHPKLGTRPISVRGVSQLGLGESIEFHEDFYDVGAMLYEQLPLLGNLTRWLRLRLAS